MGTVYITFHKSEFPVGSAQFPLSITMELDITLGLPVEKLMTFIHCFYINFVLELEHPSNVAIRQLRPITIK